MTLDEEAFRLLKLGFLVSLILIESIERGVNSSPWSLWIRHGADDFAVNVDDYAPGLVAGDDRNAIISETNRTQGIGPVAGLAFNKFRVDTFLHVGFSDEDAVSHVKERVDENRFP